MKKFTLKILWLNDNIGIAIEHIVKEGYSPLTSYVFWPRNDAWKQIKTELDSKPWISNHDKIELLNITTLIINYWQDKNQTVSIEEAKQKFPNLIFLGDYY